MENNCGFNRISKFIKPPFWVFFNASCEIHDDNYAKGGTKKEKLQTDVGFLWRMLQDSNQVESYEDKKKAVDAAIRYYYAVRWFGRLSWNKKPIAK